MAPKSDQRKRLGIDDAPSSSQPQPNQRNSAINPQRRIKTSNDALTTAMPGISYGNAPLPPTSLPTFRAQILAKIKSRLEDASIPTENIHESHLSWLLPTKLGFEAEWAATLHHPLLTPTATIARIMSLVLSGPSSRPNSLSETVFYIRTFVFTASELLTILNEIFDHSLNPLSNLFGWADIVLATIAKPTQIQEGQINVQSSHKFYVRYCGTTTGYTAWNRHAWDLKHGNGFAAKFIQTIGYLCPKVLDSAEIMVVANATIDFPVHGAHIDLREQTLIAMFNSGILNTERGGKSTSFQPSSSDYELFAELNTSVLDRLIGTSSWGLHENPTAESAIQTLARDVQTYALDNPDTTGTSRIPYSDELREVMAQQALCMQLVTAAAPVVIVGSDIPPGVGASPSPFLQGSVPSGALTASVIDTLCGWERARRTPAAALDLSQRKLLPFIDLYPWMKKNQSDLPSALKFTREYMSITKPLVVVSFGAHVSAVALGSFMHEFGINQSSVRFTDTVGTPEIRLFGENGDTPTIVIPCFHPGSVCYGGAAKDVMSLIFHMVMVRMWYALDAIMRRRDYSNRTSLVNEVLRELGQYTGTNTPFWHRFAELKAEYLRLTKQRFYGPRDLSAVQFRQVRRGTKADQQLAEAEKIAGDVALIREQKARVVVNLSEQQAERTNEIATDRVTSWKAGFESSHDTTTFTLNADGDTPVLSAEASWAATKHEFYLVILCARTVGDPKSAARQEQVKKLVKLEIAPLRAASGKSNKKAFAEWGCSLTKGVSYYLQAATIEQQLEDIPNLLALFDKSQTITTIPHRISDKRVAQAASGDLHVYLKQSKVLGDEDSLAESLTKADRQWLALINDRAPTYAKTERQRQKDTTRFRYRQTDRLNGSEVQIVAFRNKPGQSIMRLDWSDGDGNRFWLKDFMVPYGIQPTDAHDKRYIWFVRAGIDITDKDGASLGVGGSGKPVTIPLANLILNLDAHVEGPFRKLWEAQTGLSFEASLQTSQAVELGPLTSDEQMVIPARFFRGRSQPFNTSSRVHEKAADKEIGTLIPLQPGDALWLLNEFLKEFYPDGGEVDCGNPAIFLSINSVWTNLTIFCAKPKFSRHPQLLHLKSLAEFARQDDDATQGSITYLGAALKVLRSPWKKARVGTAKVPTLRGMRAGGRTVYTIGADVPPNIADDHVPPLVHPKSAQGREQIAEGEDPVVSENDVDDGDRDDSDLEMLEA